MTTKDEKGQMGFHFLPSFALNCDHRYDDDPDNDHDDNRADGEVSPFWPILLWIFGDDFNEAGNHKFDVYFFHFFQMLLPGSIENCPFCLEEWRNGGQMKEWEKGSVVHFITPDPSCGALVVAAVNSIDQQQL